MAIRYSGDVEVKMTYLNRRINFLVRAPKFRQKGAFFYRPFSSRPSSDEYDHLAIHILITLSHRRLPFDRHRSTKAIRVSRLFRAPCPIRF